MTVELPESARAILGARATIPFRTALGGIRPEDCKLHCAMRNQYGDEPLAVYERSWDEWLGWNRWRPKVDAFNRRYIVALMRSYAEQDTWFFGGLFEVTGRTGVPGENGYELQLVDHPIQAGVGRMKVRLHLPSKQGRRDLETLVDDMAILEAWGATGWEAEAGGAGSEDEDHYVTEGGMQAARSHRARERNSQIVAHKKDDVLRRTGRLACEVCEYDFATRWSDGLGVGFAECHHLVHLADAGERRTTLHDLAIVCPNCHRMFHRLESGTTVQELRAKLASS